MQLSTQLLAWFQWKDIPFIGMCISGSQNKCNKEKLKTFYFPLNLQTTYSIYLVFIAVHVLFWGMLIITVMTVSKTLGVYDPCYQRA